MFRQTKLSSALAVFSSSVLVSVACSAKGNCVSIAVISARRVQKVSAICVPLPTMMNDVKSIFAWGARSINAEDQHLSHQVMQISSEVIVFFTQTHHNYLSKTYCEIKYG